MNMREEEELMPVNLSLAEIKVLGARWLVQMFDHLTDNPYVIVNGFIETGISGSVSNAITTCCEEYEYSSSDDDVSDGSIEATFPTKYLVFPSHSKIIVKTYSSD